jgi:small subunit ribosomal protein S6
MVAILSRVKNRGTKDQKEVKVMAKIREKYEAVVVFSVKDEDAVPALVTKFSDLLKEKAELVNIDEWGKRRLAYPINYENDGYYVLYHFDATPDVPVEFERVINITESVLRSMVVLRQGEIGSKSGAPVKAVEAVEVAEAVEAAEEAEAIETGGDEAPAEN